MYTNMHSMFVLGFARDSAYKFTFLTMYTTLVARFMSQSVNFQNFKSVIRAFIQTLAAVPNESVSSFHCPVHKPHAKTIPI